MKRFALIIFTLMLVQFLQPHSLKAQPNAATKNILTNEYNLVPVHSKDTQYYQMESRLQKQSPDGSPAGLDIYRLQLRCVPSADPKKGDEYTCIGFTVQVNNAPLFSIPSLAGWKYYFLQSATTEEQHGLVFGIDHAKFDGLKDENGKSLAIENGYHVYNSFVDFHSMSVFSEKTNGGKGIQDLKHIGDKVIHQSSFSKPPVNVGAGVGEGSYFQNGEITLSFKGLGLVNEKACAILEYDSGESSFFMRVKPTLQMEIPTKGSSHYWGDIYKDISGGWIELATLHELVVSQTSVPGMNNKINSVIERSISIRNVK
jgi:hypothetical protein